MLPVDIHRELGDARLGVHRHLGRATIVTKGELTPHEGDAPIGPPLVLHLMLAGLLARVLQIHAAHA